MSRTMTYFALYENGSPVSSERQGEMCEVVGPSLERLADEICNHFDVVDFASLGITVNKDGVFTYDGKTYQIVKEEVKTSELLGFEVKRFNDYVNS